MKVLLTLVFVAASFCFCGTAIYRAWPKTRLPVEITIIQTERGYVVPPYQYLSAQKRTYIDI